MHSINTLLEKLNNAKPLDFGDIINKSIELFKKVWVQGLVIMLITMLLLLPFYLLMYLPMIGMGLIDPDLFQHGQGANFFLMIPFFVFTMIFSFFAMVIGFGMKASFFRICKSKDLNETTADDYFFYLKKPYLVKVITLSLITYGISVIAVLLCVLPIIYVMVPITLMNVIFAFNPDLSASNIVKAGFQLGNKKWWLTFGLMIVSGLLAEIVGLLMCCIGVFVTMSFAYIPLYFIYKQSIGFEESTEMQQIGIIDQL
jgi:hypothetical protein